MSAWRRCASANAKACPIEHAAKSFLPMSTRIDRRFEELKSQGRAALVTFLTAGDPDPETSLALLRAVPAAGADVVELGMPFTDPMADGPAIQLSSQRALKAGMNFIRLATPTTDDKRLPAVLANTSGFVYYVSITGITGAATPDPAKVAAAVGRIKRHTKLPVAVGFGVRTAEQAAVIAAGADGVVVGSALVNALKASLDRDGKATAKTVTVVVNLVAELARGVRGARRVAAE